MLSPLLSPCGVVISLPSIFFVHSEIFGKTEGFLLAAVEGNGWGQRNF